MPVGGSVEEGVAICATVGAALFAGEALCLRGLERCLYEAVSTWAAWFALYTEPPRVDMVPGDAGALCVRVLREST